MLAKIIISIVSFLLVLFPFSSTLSGAYQQLTFPGVHEITNDIIDAVKSNDIQAIEGMLSEEAKQRMENPQKAISEFLKAFDGEVIESRYLQSAGGETSSGMGYVYKVETWTIEIKTIKSTYWLSTTWIIADTRSPQHVGMSSMLLSDIEDNILAELYA